MLCTESVPECAVWVSKPTPGAAGPREHSAGLWQGTLCLAAQDPPLAKAARPGTEAASYQGPIQFT